MTKSFFVNLESPIQKIAVLVKSLHRYATLKICLWIFLLKIAVMTIQILQRRLPEGQKETEFERLFPDGMK